MPDTIVGKKLELVEIIVPGVGKFSTLCAFAVDGKMHMLEKNEIATNMQNNL